jgi:hypothetical protein
MATNGELLSTPFANKFHFDGSGKMNEWQSQDRVRLRNSRVPREIAQQEVPKWLEISYFAAVLEESWIEKERR